MNASPGLFHGGRPGREVVGTGQKSGLWIVYSILPEERYAAAAAHSSDFGKNSSGLRALTSSSLLAPLCPRYSAAQARKRAFLVSFRNVGYAASSGGAIAVSWHPRFPSSRLSRKYKDYITLVRHASATANICLRPLSHADFASLADLWLASWQEAMPGIDFPARRQWFFDHLRTLEANGYVAVCAIDGTGSIVGFVSIDPATAYLDQLAVAPAAKGTGVARLLLEEARRISPQGIVLEVNEENQRALAFYKREGFEKISDGVNPRSGLKTFRLRSPASCQRRCSSS